MSEDIQAKIIKLLQRTEANSGSTQAEMEQALGMARRLAAKHNIDIALLNTAQNTKSGEPFVTERHTPVRSDGKPCETRLPVCHKHIAPILDSFFRVSTITGTAPKLLDGRWKKDVPEAEITKIYDAREKKLKAWEKVRKWENGDWTPAKPAWPSRMAKFVEFHGRKSDVAIAIYVYNFLYHEYQRLWDEHVRAAGVANKMILWQERNGFFLGIKTGLMDKLLEEKGVQDREMQQELKERAGHDGKTFGIVVLKEEEKREADLKEAHPLLQYVSTDEGPIDNWATFGAGREKGGKLNIRDSLK